MCNNQDLLVRVELGMVLPFGDSQYNNIKPLVSMTLNPYSEESIDSQVERALAAATVAFAKIDEQMSVVVTDLIAPASGSPTFGDRLTALEDYRKTASSNFKKIQVKMNELATAAPSIAAEVKPK